MCQEEKCDLEKKLKIYTIKAQKTDEYKLKYDHLSENFKILKSKHALLVEKVKKHIDSGMCPIGNEFNKAIEKLSVSKFEAYNSTISANLN